MLRQMSFYLTPTIAIEDCRLIYEPRGRAREYAALACNVYSGCDHGCVYCYAPWTTRKNPNDFRKSRERPGFLSRLEQEAAAYSATETDERILLSFTCDPYQRLDSELRITRQALQIFREYGLNVQVLTKGGKRALRDLDLFTPADAFATTMTFLDDTRSQQWEPWAALPGNRIETIKTFHSAGIPTWVSLEPVIDPEASLQIIRQLYPWVDVFKVGKLNYHPLSLTTDWSEFVHQAVALLKSLDQDYYIKKDLASYL